MNLSFKKYPEEVPPNGSSFFFIADGYYGLSTGYARAEYTWHDGHGTQVIYTGKETLKEIQELTDEGYVVEHFFIPDEGSHTPHGKFLWTSDDEIVKLWNETFPDDAYEKEEAPEDEDWLC